MKRPAILSLIPLAFLSTACSIGGAQADLHGQERQSCAEMGIDPGSGAFQSCVANLDATLFQASNVGSR